MSGIQVISKQSHDIMLASEQNSANIKMDTPSVVLIQEKLQNVAEIKKDGNDLLVIMNDGQAIVLQDYFVQGMTEHELVFDEGSQQLIWTQFTDLKNFVDGVTYENIKSVNALLDFNLGLPLPEATPLLYGLGVAGLIAGGIVSLSNDSNSTTSNTNVVAAPNRASSNVSMISYDQVNEDQTDASADDQASQLNTDSSGSEAVTSETNEKTTVADDSQGDAATNPDAMFNLLSNAENQATQSSTLMESATQPSADFDWSALFSDNSMPTEIEIPEQPETQATSAENNSVNDSSATTQQTTDQFSVPSFNLFELLNTQWLA